MSEGTVKKSAEKMLNLTIRVPETIWDIYHEGSENGWDASEDGRQALIEKFRRLSDAYKRPAKKPAS